MLFHFHAVGFGRTILAHGVAWPPDCILRGSGRILNRLGLDRARTFSARPARSEPDLEPTSLL